MKPLKNMTCFTNSKVLFINRILLFTLCFFIQKTIALAGEVSFSIIPIEEAETTKSMHSWVIPIPNNLINTSEQLVLLDKNNLSIPATFTAILLWPNEEKRQYIRSLIISIPKSQSNDTYYLRWQKKQLSNIQDPKGLFTITHNAKISADWLALTFHSPTATPNQNKLNSWFDISQEHYGRFIAEPNSFPKLKKYTFSLSKPSIWLYDRPYNFYLLYLKTGDLFWKTKAHQAAVFYMKNINTEGYFSLKKINDFKYANTQGLILDYIFYPNPATKEIISRIYNMTLSWQPNVKKEGFWTERHHNTALTAAISQWVISNDTKALKRVKKFIDNTISTLNNSYNANCLKHSYLSHEGKKINTQVCSPWMTALLIEQFWRFYHLTYDYKSAVIIEKFSTFLIGSGTYNFTYGKELSSVPKYLALLNLPKKEKHDPWSDLHHACDVASAIAKAAYFKKMQHKNYKNLTSILKTMLKTCHRSMYRTNPAEAWPIAPPRKFNWWYGSTASFTWLLKELNMHK